MTEVDPKRGYFLSAKDAEQLLQIVKSLGFDLTDWLADRTQSSFVKRLDQVDEWYDRLGRESDSTYSHLRAVIENCKTATPEMIRHQLVGLLPETREMEPAEAARMREHGLGTLVDLQELRVREGWKQYGYGESQGRGQAG